MDRFADVERLAYGTIEYDLTKLPVRNLKFEIVLKN